MISNIGWFLICQRKKLIKNYKIISKESSSTSTIILGPCKIIDERTEVDKLLKGNVKIEIITHFENSTCFSKGFPDYAVKGFPDYKVIITD